MPAPGSQAGVPATSPEDGNPDAPLGGAAAPPMGRLQARPRSATLQAPADRPQARTASGHGGAATWSAARPRTQASREPGTHRVHTATATGGVEGAPAVTYGQQKRRSAARPIHELAFGGGMGRSSSLPTRLPRALRALATRR